MIDHCYVCLNEEGVLVRPCGNEKCTARIHEACLAKQCQSNRKCGLCRDDVIITTTINFKKESCFETYMVRLFFIFIYPTSIFLLSMGQTLPIACRSLNDYHCDKGLLQGQLLYYIIFPVFTFAAIICYYCTALGDRINYYTQDLYQKTKIGFCLITWLGTLSLVMIAHGIGYLIIKWGFEIDEFLTWRTVSAGYTIYCLIGIIMLFIYMIHNIILYLRGSTFDEFYESTTKFGVTIPEVTNLIQ